MTLSHNSLVLCSATSVGSKPACTCFRTTQLEGETDAESVCASLYTFIKNPTAANHCLLWNLCVDTPRHILQTFDFCFVFSKVSLWPQILPRHTPVLRMPSVPSATGPPPADSPEDSCSCLPPAPDGKRKSQEVQAQFPAVDPTLSVAFVGQLDWNQPFQLAFLLVVIDMDFHSKEEEYVVSS